MITHPNCKINIGLQVVGRRSDGYHDLETLFVPVPLYDELEVTLAPNFSFVQQGLALDNAPDDNLCVRAYRLLQNDYPQVGPVAMRLTKRIPFGAGLGGGSSDAAFVLKMVTQLFALPCSLSDLESYAARLGADCPFFVQNRSAFATGIGDVLTPVNLDLSSYRLVLLKPSDYVSTKEAYSGLDATLGISQACRRTPVVYLPEVVRQPVEQWRDQVSNDFELSVFPNHPRIAFLKEYLYRQGALYASMSGSGSAVFGIFDRQSPISLTDIPQSEIVLL